MAKFSKVQLPKTKIGKFWSNCFLEIERQRESEKENIFFKGNFWNISFPFPRFGLIQRCWRKLWLNHKFHGCQTGKIQIGREQSGCDLAVSTSNTFILTGIWKLLYNNWNTANIILHCSQRNKIGLKFV